MRARASKTLSISDFLGSLASQTDVHGAVSASAVAASMGTALLLMVAGLPKTRSGSLKDRSVLEDAAAELGGIQKQLEEAIEIETAVKVFAARKLPQADDTQRAERDAAIQVALRAPAEVPLEIMRLSTIGLKHAQTVAAHSSRAASHDVQLAVGLLRTGLIGAQASLDAKLGSLTDVIYAGDVADEMARLSEEAMAAATSAERSAQAPPS